MLKRFDKDNFSACKLALGDEVGELSMVLPAISGAMTRNSSHEFADSQMSTQYQKLYNCLSERKSNIINHEIILGKRNTLLYDLDRNKGEALFSELDAFQSIRNNIRSLADDVISHAADLKADPNLESLISMEDLEFTLYMQEQLDSLGFVYEEFILLSEYEQFELMKTYTEVAKNYFITHDMDVPLGKKKYVCVGYGIAFYYESGTSLNTNYSDNVSVEITSVSQANFHVMTDDANDHYFDVSLEQCLGIRYAAEIDDERSAYVEAVINPGAGIYGVEDGVTETITLAQNSTGQGIDAQLEVGCGVEICVPTERFQEEEVPEYSYDELMETNGLYPQQDPVMEFIEDSVFLYTIFEIIETGEWLLIF